MGRALHRTAPSTVLKSWEVHQKRRTRPSFLALELVRFWTFYEFVLLRCLWCFCFLEFWCMKCMWYHDNRHEQEKTWKCQIKCWKKSEEWRHETTVFPSQILWLPSIRSPSKKQIGNLAARLSPVAKKNCRMITDSPTPSDMQDMHSQSANTCLEVSKNYCVWLPQVVQRACSHMIMYVWWSINSLSE